MLIGELSKHAGISRDTIRYYEKIRLLASAARSNTSGYKQYGQAALDRLRHVAQLKALGFTLGEIRNLLDNKAQGHPCAGLPDQLATKIARLTAQISLLSQIKSDLLAMHSACSPACSTSSGMPSCVPWQKPACC